MKLHEAINNAYIHALINAAPLVRELREHDNEYAEELLSRVLLYFAAEADEAVTAFGEAVTNYFFGDTVPDEVLEFIKDCTAPKSEELYKAFDVEQHE